ncbi:hypothetical protein COLO4_15542 [Corchorus olitorius]|uniref:Uncharacterized protein n=1 Tax=Corchorus olitorius TaxID=93759 RepID=A0A1R3JMJ2_9ROSI|nr:hypothetical protein COLO4_15542 [Corchorus olitorius]
MRDCATTEEFLSKENSLYNEILGPERYSRVRGFGLLPQPNRFFNNNDDASTSAANVAGPSSQFPHFRNINAFKSRWQSCRKSTIESRRKQRLHMHLSKTSLMTCKHWCTTFVVGMEICKMLRMRILR